MVAKRVYEGGFNTYGRSLGILMLETTTPRPPGDIGNARTFDYPVKYEVVDGATPVRVVREQDSELLEPFRKAAMSLVDQGVVAITTNCGFLLGFQTELSDCIPEVPVFTSSLLQIPLVKSMIAQEQQIGILSADEMKLKELDHPLLVENRNRLVIEGLATSEPFQEVLIDRSNDKLDLDLVGKEVINATERLITGNSIGAIIFECTNLRPYIQDVQEITGLPVFDYLTLADLAWQASKGTRY